MTDDLEDFKNPGYLGISAPSEIGMSEEDLYKWKFRVKRGEAYELKGPYNESVFLQKIFSDVAPENAEAKNQLRLKRLQKKIKELKKSRKKPQFPIA